MDLKEIQDYVKEHGGEISPDQARRVALALELDEWFKSKNLIPAEIVSSCISQIASRVAKDAKNPKHLEQGKELLAKLLVRRIDLAYLLVQKMREQSNVEKD